MEIIVEVKENIEKCINSIILSNIRDNKKALQWDAYHLLQWPSLLPCMPPAMHAPHHACPSKMLLGQACAPAMHAPVMHAPHHACLHHLPCMPPAMHTPNHAMPPP